MAEYPFSNSSHFFKNLLELRYTSLENLLLVWSYSFCFSGRGFLNSIKKTSKYLGFLINYLEK